MSILYIVIPAYNESKNIKSVINDWYPVVERCGADSRLIIFDGTSPDGTAGIVSEMQQTRPMLALQIYPKCGHGATLQIAYRYALAQGADYVFQTDADGQTLASEFKQLWDAREQYDVQIGFRKSRGDGINRWIVTRTLRIVLFLIFGLWIQDANTPFRLMSRMTLEQNLPKVPEGYNLTNTLLTVSFHKQKERIRYVPITFRSRQGGENALAMKQIVKIGFRSIKDFISMRDAL